MVNQNQANMPFIRHGFPTTFGAQGIPLQYPYGLPSTTFGVQARPNQSHGIPSQYFHGIPPTASTIHPIPSHSLGYQLIPPISYYSLVYS